MAGTQPAFSPRHSERDIPIQSDLVVLPDLKLPGSDHYYQKNTAGPHTKTTPFRRRFWHQFLSHVDTIPCDLYAMHAPSVSSVDDINYIYTTAIAEALLPKQLPRSTVLSGRVLKGGHYLRIKTYQETLTEIMNGYNDIIHSVYEKYCLSLICYAEKGPILSTINSQPPIRIMTL